MSTVAHRGAVGGYDLRGVLQRRCVVSIIYTRDMYSMQTSDQQRLVACRRLVEICRTHSAHSSTRVCDMVDCSRYEADELGLVQ